MYEAELIASANENESQTSTFRCVGAVQQVRKSHNIFPEHIRISTYTQLVFVII
jgi:hypothetical protein